MEVIAPSEIEHPSRPSRKFFRKARSTVRKCGQTIKRFTNRTMSLSLSPAKGDVPVLNGDVMERIFGHLSLKERHQIRPTCRLVREVVDRIPIHLAFLQFRLIEGGIIEMTSREFSFVTGRLINLNELKGDWVKTEESIQMDLRTAVRVITGIVSKVSSIEHLWLDCGYNGHMVQAVVDYFANVDTRRRLAISHLTVIGSPFLSDFNSFTKLILMSRRSLCSLRFRDVTLHSDYTLSFWNAVAQCHKLSLLQYEPHTSDRLSRKHILEALAHKQLRCLVLTKVVGLSVSDLNKVVVPGTLTELSIVGDLITPSTIYNSEMRRVIPHLRTLLIQVDDGFSMENDDEYEDIQRILLTLPISSSLEVVHIMQPGDTVLNSLTYWLTLARVTGRTISLKIDEQIDDITQERLDAAVGKLLRKSGDVQRGEFTNCGVCLTYGDGSLLLLDRKTWFGDEDHF